VERGRDGSLLLLGVRGVTSPSQNWVLKYHMKEKPKTKLGLVSGLKEFGTTNPNSVAKKSQSISKGFQLRL
jgi:hypothetical protein